jgi:hypothetical protein
VEQASAKPTGIPFISPDLRMAAAKDGVSPNASSVEIGGRTLEIVRLDTRLADLDTQTARYREPEINSSASGSYMNSVLIPNEIRFLVTISPRDGTRMLDFQFPREPVGGGSSGVRSINLTDFFTYVRNLSGQDATRVNFIVDPGTFNNNGVTTAFTNLYIFPLNSQGQPITRRGNGEYIIYAATYYSNQSGGSASLLVEPDNRDSLYARR